MLVLLLRHAESVSNAETGRDLPEAEGDRLTATGRSQAQLAARGLADCGATALWSSPLGRARETADALSAALGLAVEVRPQLRELGEADGYLELSGDEQRARRWSNWMADHADDRSFAPPGAESFEQLYARVEAVKAELLARPDDRVIAVTHGIFLRFFFIHTLLGDAYPPGWTRRLWQLRTLNCGLSAFEHRPPGDPLDPAPDEWLCLTWMARPWDPPRRAGSARSARSDPGR